MKDRQSLDGSLAVIGTYVPRQCGSAPFSHDLLSAVSTPGSERPQLAPDRVRAVGPDRRGPASDAGRDSSGRRAWPMSRGMRTAMVPVVISVPFRRRSRREFKNVRTKQDIDEEAAPWPAKPS